MTSLLARLFQPKPKVDHLRVAVYTRKECCCCHTAIDFLKGYQRRLKFRLDLIDVDSDPELVAAYGLTVPVVTINDKVRFRGVINKVLFDRILNAEDVRN